MSFPRGWWRSGKPRRSSNPALTLQNGLVSFWKLGEVSGVRADDLSAHPLTDNNTVTQAAGKVGNGAFFTAANSESLTHVDHADFRMSGTRTMAGWFKATANAGGGQALITKYASAGAGPGFAGNEWFLIDVGNDPNTVFRFGVSKADGTAETLANSAATTHIGAWFFVVAWYDAAGATINIQVNDGAVVSVAHAGGVKVDTSPFSLGGNWNFYGGTMDAVGWWSRVLTAGERTYLYNAGAGREHPFT